MNKVLIFIYYLRNDTYYKASTYGCIIRNNRMHNNLRGKQKLPQPANGQQESCRRIVEISHFHAIVHENQSDTILNQLYNDTLGCLVFNTGLNKRNYGYTLLKSYGQINGCR